MCNQISHISRRQLLKKGNVTPLFGCGNLAKAARPLVVGGETKYRTRVLIGYGSHLISSKGRILPFISGFGFYILMRCQKYVHVRVQCAYV